LSLRGVASGAVREIFGKCWMFGGEMPARPQGFCRFCGGSGLTDAHIWDEWLQDLIPAGWDRWESWVSGPSGTNIDDPSIYERKPKQGAVHTKVSRKICGRCNNEWMNQIGLAAKDAVTQLVQGMSIELLTDQQRAVATWFALAAMLADLQTRSETKFPESDRQYMFLNKKPPPHWFIFIGQYGGSSVFPFAADNASLNLRLGSETAPVAVALQVKTMAMGRLYGAVLVHSPPHAPNMTAGILTIHQPWLISIQPQIAPAITFPRPANVSITGELAVGAGSLARDLATRYVKRYEAVCNGVKAQLEGDTR
jgi:hypothetical protein